MKARTPIGEPMCRCGRQSRVGVHARGLWVVAGVKTCIQKNNMTIDFFSCCFLSLFHVLNIDVGKVGDVGKVKANRLPHEKIDRHFIDRLPIGIGVEEGIDVRPDVIEHAEIFDCRRKRILRRSKTEFLAPVVCEVGNIDRPWHGLVCRHEVFDRDGKINDTGHFLIPSVR
jgi:hypothetical protein